MNLLTSRQSAFTLIEISIVVALVGLLAAIAVPNFVRARATSQRNTCINNLRRIDDAMQEWALECRRNAMSAVQYTDIAPFLKRSVACPAGGTSFEDSYLITTVEEAPTCQRLGEEHLLPDTVRNRGKTPDPKGHAYGLYK